MDNTNEIRAACAVPEVNKELRDLLKGLIEFGTYDNTTADKRQLVVVEFTRRCHTLSEKCKKALDTIYKRERVHYEAVNLIFPDAYELQFKEVLPATRPKHDHTKDNLFCLTLAVYFDMLMNDNHKIAEARKVDENTENDPFLTKWMPKQKERVDAELARHYKEETGHHPEFEKMNGRDCDIYDIFEMAIDKLLRNLQFNNGNINTQQMEKFLPTFHLGDEDAKMAKVTQYKRFVLDHQEYLVNRIRELYFPDLVGKPINLVHWDM